LPLCLATGVVYRIEYFVVPHVHSVLIRYEFLQAGPVFHGRQLTEALRQRLGDAVQPKAQMCVSGSGVTVADSAAISTSLDHYFAVQSLHCDTPPSTVLHRATTTLRMPGVAGNLIEPLFQNDSPDSLLKFKCLLLNLCGTPLKLVLDNSLFLLIDPNCNLNQHNALLGKAGFLTPS
jgi:hypothetical protein